MIIKHKSLKAKENGFIANLKVKIFLSKGYKFVEELETDYFETKTEENEEKTAFSCSLLYDHYSERNIPLEVVD